MKLSGIDFLALCRETLPQGRSIRFRALGGSMRPFIRHGQVIQVDSVQIEDLGLGDIIFYRRGMESLVAHRLVAKRYLQDNLSLFTRGDAQPVAEQVAPEQVLGRVVGVEWWPGWTLRVDNGPGRQIGLFLARIGYFLAMVSRALKRVKNINTPAGLIRCPRSRQA